MILVVIVIFQHVVVPHTKAAAQCARVVFHFLDFEKKMQNLKWIPMQETMPTDDEGTDALVKVMERLHITTAVGRVVHLRIKPRSSRTPS
jgi:hypothetical protein